MGLFAVLLQLFLATAAFAQRGAADHSSEPQYERQKAAIDAYFQRLANSIDPTERALHLLHIAPHTEPREFAELGRQWELSNPSPQAIHILASTACSWVRMAACSDALFARWSQQDPDNAYIWAIAANRAERMGRNEQAERRIARTMASTRFDAGFWTVLSALRNSLQSDAEFSQLSPSTRALAALDIAATTGMPIFNDVDQLCPRNGPMVNADRIGVCLHLGQLMLYQSNHRLSANHGHLIIDLTAADEDERTVARQHWEHWQALAAQIAADRRLQADPVTAAASNDINLYLQQILELGEMEAMIHWLAETAQLDANVVAVSAR